MFKIGDKVVCVDKNYAHYIKLHEVYEIVGVGRRFLTVRYSYEGHNKGKELYIPIKSAISYEVYNSPLYKLMKENND